MRGPTVYLRSGSAVWYYSFTASGKRHQGTTGERERSKAQEAAQRYYEVAVGGGSQRRPGERVRDSDYGKEHPQGAFDRHVRDLERTGRDAATRSNYQRYAARYREFFHERTIGSLTQREIEEWRDWLLSLKRGDAGHGERTLSPKYVSEHLNWLAAVYNHFGLPNTLRRIERPKVSDDERQRALKCFTTEEMGTMFAACAPDFKNCFVFLAYTGCRIGELLGIARRTEDINDAEQIVWVTGKGKRRRPLTLRGPGQAAWDALCGEIARRGVREGEPVFRPYERWADKRLRSLCRQVGIAPRGPHALRHTFATHALLVWKWDISMVAKWLGHRNIDVTYRVYGHLIPQVPPRMWGWDIEAVGADGVSL